MADGRDIMELGFDYNLTKSESAIVRDELTKTLELAEKLDGFKIQIKTSDGFGELKAAIKDATATFGDLQKKATELGALEQKLAKITSDRAKATKRSEDADRAAAKASGELEKAIQEEERAKREKIKTDEAAAKSVLALEKAIQQEYKTAREKLKLDADMAAQYAKTANQEAKREQNTKEQTRAYKALGREYNILRKVAEDYGARLGVESAKFQEAAKRANDLNSKLKAIDAAIGNYGRSVGNYKTAFDGLSFSFTQIARELPSLSNGFQTFASAIGNNIPMAADYIAEARAELAALRAEGLAAPTMFQKITGAIFTWQVGLSVAVALFTVFGKQIGEFFQKLIKGKDTFDRAAEQQKILNEAIRDSNGAYATAIKQVQELRTNVDLAKNGFLSKTEVVKQYNDTIGKAAGDVKTLDEVEQSLVKNGDRYIQMMLYKAAAQTAFEKAAAEAIKIEERRRQLESIPIIAGPGRTSAGIEQELQFREAANKRRLKEEGKAAQESLDIAAYFQKKAAEIAKEGGFSLLGNDKEAKSKFKKELDELKDALRRRYEQEIAAWEELAAFQSLSTEQRLFAESQANEKRIELIKGLAEIEVKFAKQTGKSLIAISEETANELLENRRKGDASIRTIQADAAKFNEAFHIKEVEEAKNFDAEILASRSNRIKDELEIYQSGARSLADLMAARYADEQTALIKARNDRKITEDRFQREMAELNLKYSKESTQALIDAAEKQLKVVQVGSDAWVALKKAIADAKKQLAEFGSVNLPLQNLQKALNDIAAAAQNITAAISTVNDIGYENQKAELQAVEDQRQKNYEAEVTRINNSRLTDEEKANRLISLESTRNQQRIQFERQQREADNKKAKFDRDINILNIIAGTAAAVVKALPNIPLSIAVGVAGAAQLAKALSVKVPQYFKQTPDSGHPKDGPAIYGEVPEMVFEPGKKPYLVTEPTFNPMLPAGTHVKHLDSDMVQGYMRSAMAKNTSRTLAMGNYLDRNSTDRQILDAISFQTRVLKKAYGSGSGSRVDVNVHTTSDHKVFIDKYVKGKRA